MSDERDLLQLKIENAKKDLPKETLEAIDAVDWKTVILGMKEKRGYTFEQLGDLEIETELLLYGLSKPEDYPKELEERMGITRSQANELVIEMNELVFKKIREELIKNSERQRIFQAKNSKKENTILEDQKLPPTATTLASEGVVIPTSVNKARPNDLSLGLALPVIEKSDVKVLDSSGIRIIEPTPNVATKVAQKPFEEREDLLKKVENPDLIPKKPEEKTHKILTQKLIDPFKKIAVVKTDHSLGNLTGTNGAKGSSTLGSSSPSSYPAKADPYRLSPDE